MVIPLPDIIQRQSLPLCSEGALKHIYVRKGRFREG
jgi:hypothetical protein